MLNALERLANGYEGSIRHLKAEMALRNGQLRDYEGRVGKEFEHDRYASQLADLRDELRMGLSDGASEEARGKVAELAEKIRELRAANEVEAAPERTGARKAVAGGTAGDGADSGAAQPGGEAGRVRNCK